MATPRTPLEPESVLELPLANGVNGYEFVDGKPVPVTPALMEHGRLIVAVAVRLYNYVRQHGIQGMVYSDGGYVLGLPHDRRRMRAPDVSFVSQATLDRHGDPGERFARFVPELAIEIDIGSGKKPHGLQRIRDYLEAGVRLVWSIRSRTRTATVHRMNGSVLELTEQDALHGEDIVPGFTLPIADLFD